MPFDINVKGYIIQTLAERYVTHIADATRKSGAMFKAPAHTDTLCHLEQKHIIYRKYGPGPIEYHFTGEGLEDLEVRYAIIQEAWTAIARHEEQIAKLKSTIRRFEQEVQR
jgi:hypothetical protein